MSDDLLWLEGALALSGVLILLFAARAFMSRHAWSDGAEYEMLDMEIPRHADVGDPHSGDASRNAFRNTDDGADDSADDGTERNGVRDAVCEASGNTDRFTGSNADRMTGGNTGRMTGGNTEYTADSGSTGVAGRGEMRHPGNRERRGALGLEDRVVRFGFVVALNYLAFTWFGLGTPAMLAFVTLGAYSLLTACFGRDPIYAYFGITTTFRG